MIQGLPTWPGYSLYRSLIVDILIWPHTACIKVPCLSKQGTDGRSLDIAGPGTVGKKRFSWEEPAFAIYCLLPWMRHRLIRATLCMALRWHRACMCKRTWPYPRLCYLVGMKLDRLYCSCGKFTLDIAMSVVQNHIPPPTPPKKTQQQIHSFISCTAHT